MISDKTLSTAVWIYYNNLPYNNDSFEPRKSHENMSNNDCSSLMRQKKFLFLKAFVYMIYSLFNRFIFWSHTFSKVWVPKCKFKKVPISTITHHLQWWQSRQKSHTYHTWESTLQESNNSVLIYSNIHPIYACSSYANNQMLFPRRNHTVNVHKNTSLHLYDNHSWCYISKIN